MTQFYGIFYNDQAGSGEAATVGYQVIKAFAAHGLKSQIITTRIDGNQAGKSPMNLAYIPERFSLIVPLTSAN